ncbi:uncharacterized protein LOC119828772 [Zerene cesonia]|uniref:uncharacterized protein LOC119828772 n=1 Tax=Zerene cesonia TaxID=33412 RepID=UPI0018E59108|nr:uncharacterized protein LOC119828772 [Zerene cesonia]
MMEVFLYNSTVCRLCGEENDNGTLLYTHEENNQNLSEIVNTYLPIKVSDDGHLPRTICPGCTIQLEATVEFFNLIINGQKIIRDLHQRENEYKKNVLNSVTESDVIAEKIVYEISTGDGVYHVEHPISLQVAGLDKPKRKRGRPSKKLKTPEELALEAAAAAAAKEQEAKNRAENKVHEDETNGKRRRKTPTRFREAVQGKELEKIFMEEGVIDKEDKDSDVKSENEMKNKAVCKEAEIIGHVATSGEPVVIVKGKGRGRPKGAKQRPNRSQCPICDLEFWSVGRYMSHVAAHHPLQSHLPHLQQNKSENGSPVEVEIETEQAETPETFDEQPNSVDFKIASTTETSDTNVTNSDGKIGDDAVTSDLLDVDNEETVEASGKKKLKCKYCDKLFSTRQSKSLHIKAVHLGERPYACKECGAAFPYPQEIENAQCHLAPEGSLRRVHELVAAQQLAVAEVLAARAAHVALRRVHRLLVVHHRRRVVQDLRATPITHKTVLVSRRLSRNLSATPETGDTESTLSGDHIQLVIDNDHAHIDKSPKQMSLLVSERVQSPALEVTLTPEQLRHLCGSPQHHLCGSPQHHQPHPPEEGDAEEDADADGDEVIYVAYDVDSADSPAFQIIDAHQAVSIDEDKVVTTCELYPRSPLHEPQEPHEQRLQVQLASPPHVQLHDIVQHHVEVVPEPQQRAPIQFRMQDGTLLAVTSLDGETLQIVTQDGQTIPVEVNTFDGDVVETVTSSDSMESLALAEAAPPAAPAAPAPPAAPASPAPPASPASSHIAHYFTIV